MTHPQQESLLGDEAAPPRFADRFYREPLPDDVFLIGTTGVWTVITAHGIPQPQGSKVKLMHGALVDDNAKTLRPWRQNVTAATREAILIEHGEHADLPIHPRDTALQIEACFTFARPRGHFGTGRNANALKDSAPKWHTKKPDTDKLARAVLDALADAGLLTDDCQVPDVHPVKTYARPFHTHPDAMQIPGAVIRVRALT